MQASVATDPIACDLPQAHIAVIAEKLAVKVGYEPGGNLAEVVELLGGSIQSKDFWDDHKDDGSIDIRGDRDFTIYISDETSANRDRFTIAHEIGHYILHYLWQKQVAQRPIGRVMARRYGTGPTEREANWFAASFLMPETAFKKSLGRKWTEKDINRVAAIFGVSTAAARIRANSIN